MSYVLIIRSENPNSMIMFDWERNDGIKFRSVRIMLMGHSL